MKLPYSVKNQLKHAIYLPALQSSYARAVLKAPKKGQKLPPNIAMSDFNFFDRNSNLFSVHAALYSAGTTSNYLNPPDCMVTTRVRGDAQDTLVIGDSGGYQIASGNLALTNKKREDIYHWLTKYCDLAMTLDVPTGPMYEGKEDYYRTFDECLKTTLGHLEAFKQLGAENENKFLNVLQGVGMYDCDIWYDEVKHYNFHGWAIAGRKANPLQLQLWRLIKLIEDGKFDRDATWIHFLGIGDLKTAVLLTTIRDALRDRFPKCTIEVSYDTSTPFLLMSTLSAISKFNLNPTRTSVTIEQIDKNDWADSNEPFPYKGSKIGQLVTKGDVVYKHENGKLSVSELGYLILQNHNIEALVGSIDAIHQLLDGGHSRAYLEQILPRYLLEAQDSIVDVLLQKDPRKARERLMDRETLRKLDNAYKNVSKFGG